MNLSEKIQFQRKKKRITQEELAEIMEVSRQTVTKWEIGQSIPEIKKIIKLSELFGVTTDYLLKDEIEEEIYVNKNEITFSIYKFIKKLSFLIKIGVTFFIISLIGILKIFYNSLKNPVNITDWDGTHYIGFQGYLKVNNIEKLFLFFCIIGIVGIILILMYKYLEKKKIKRSKK